VQQAQVQAQLQAQHTQLQQQQQQPNPTQYSSQPHVASNQTTPKNLSGNGPSIASQITLEQALDLLSRYGYQGVVPPNAQSNIDHGHGPLSPQSAGSYGLGVQSGILNDTWRLNTMDNHNHNHSHNHPHAEPQQGGHGGFSPFEQRSPPMNDSMLSHSQTQLFNRAPGFGPSLSLPADLKISHHHRSKESTASGSPRSASTHTVFSNGDGNYHQFFDGGRSGYHLNVADILRKDSQALPRSYTNSSPRGDGEVPMKYSHSTSLAGMKSGDIRDINGMLMNLSLDLHDGARKDELDTTTAAEIWQSKESTPSPRPGEA
jgi:hypothetical protein